MQNYKNSIKLRFRAECECDSCANIHVNIMTIFYDRVEWRATTILAVTVDSKNRF